MGGADGDGLEVLARELGSDVEHDASFRATTPGLQRIAREPHARRLSAERDGRRTELIEAGGARAVLAYVPEVQAYTSQLCCDARRLLGGSRPESYPNESWEEIRLESVAFERRFRLLVLRGQHGGWMRELFSPSLISWLAHDAPPGLSFEINEGWVAVIAPIAGAEIGAADLWTAGGELIERVRREALEEDAAPNLFDRDERERSLDEPLARVEWSSPPDSPGVAAAAYRRTARFRPSVFLAGLLGAIVAAPLLAAGGYLFADIIGALGGFVVGLGAGWSIGRELAAHRVRFDGWNSGSLGAHAFMREYARSRGLERIDPARFHHDNRALPLPGRAECALRDPDGRVYAMLSDAAEMRASGATSTNPVDRPLARDVLVARVAGEPDPRPAGLPERWRIDAYAPGMLAVSRPLAGNTLRSLAACDEFRRRAAELIDAAGRPAAEANREPAD